MKYIKLFEDVDNGYVLITSDEYFNGNEGYKRTLIKFPDSEVRKLLLMLKSDNFRFLTSRTLEFKFSGTSQQIGMTFIITSLSDEWYLVCEWCSNTHYKCDQWDGLMNCLKNEFNIY